MSGAETICAATGEHFTGESGGVTIFSCGKERAGDPLFSLHCLQRYNQARSTRVNTSYRKNQETSTAVRLRSNEGFTHLGSLPGLAPVTTSSTTSTVGDVRVSCSLDSLQTNQQPEMQLTSVGRKRAPNACIRPSNCTVVLVCGILANTGAAFLS
jgi:hypothetical protein